MLVVIFYIILFSLFADSICWSSYILLFTKI